MVDGFNSRWDTADERINKNEKTEVYILTWVTHNVESKSKFQKHTVQ